MVYDRVRVLRQGSEVTLQTRPVDPRDFLRGDYVVLNYEITNLPAGALKDAPSQGRGTPGLCQACAQGGRLLSRRCRFTPSQYRSATAKC